VEGPFPPVIDQSAQASLDLIEPAEALVPRLQQAQKLGVYRPPEFEPFFELTGLEDGGDVVPVDFIGGVGRNRVGGQIGRELDHSSTSIIGRAFLVEGGGAS